MNKLLLYCLCFCTACATVRNETENRLWYTRPAAEWMEALPVGNGRIGAMIYGGITEERIALNEITLWSGAPDPNQEKECGKDRLAAIRELFFRGNPKEGNRMASEYLTGRPNTFGSHLPLGDLLLRFDYDDTLRTRYRRELDLEQAVASVSYRMGNTGYFREIFCSNPDQTLVVHLESDKAGALNFTASAALLRNAEIEVSENELNLRGRAFFHSPDEPGVRFAGKVRIVSPDGKIAAGDNTLTLRGASEAWLLIDIRTDYTGTDPDAACEKTLHKAASISYPELKKRHVADHAALFDRVSLSLGEKTDADGLPTDLRWERFKTGQDDPGLFALFAQYGRYLLIAASRENSPLPANLQGIWNDNLACSMSWNCDYHLDINTQQNYWIANSGNLPECNVPLFAFLKSLDKAGSRTARIAYGSPGWVAHTVVNPWGYTAPGEGAGWGLHPTGGTWLALQLWDHYVYTQDTLFLEKQGYPVLKNSARFFLDYMVRDPRTGYLMTGPSTSPENAFLHEGETLSLSMMPTCDRVLVHELFSACIAGSRILGRDPAFSDSLQRALSELPPLRIGKYGQLQEWFDDYEEAVPNHRHTSHLLALYPYNQISPVRTPDLARAAETTIERRLSAEAWEDVEWSRANMILFYARLKNADKAYAHLRGLLRELTRENLLTVSPKGIGGAPWDIFVFDGNEAGTAGIFEMLIQSQEGYIELLPALPDAWATGHVDGLCVRGGGVVNLSWKAGKPETFSLKALRDGVFRLKLIKTKDYNYKINQTTIYPTISDNSIITIHIKKGELFEIKNNNHSIN